MISPRAGLISAFAVAWKNLFTSPNNTMTATTLSSSVVVPHEYQSFAPGGTYAQAETLTCSPEST